MADAASSSCSFTYRPSSVNEPAGSFAVIAAIRYQVNWTCTGSCLTTGGDLGLVDAPAGAGNMTVRQRQTVVVQRAGEDTSSPSSGGPGSIRRAAEEECSWVAHGVSVTEDVDASAHRSSWGTFRVRCTTETGSDCAE